MKVVELIDDATIGSLKVAVIRVVVETEVSPPKGDVDEMVRGSANVPLPAHPAKKRTLVTMKVRTIERNRIFIYLSWTIWHLPK